MTTIAIKDTSPKPWTRFSKLDPPPLGKGTRLNRAEFERRYAAMTHIKKAELIEGVVFMPSPVHFESHGEPHADIIGWLSIYRAATPGVRLGDNVTVRLDMDNEVQPDVLLRLEKKLGGTSRISDDDYIEGPPELVIEIAASSTSSDLNDKKRVYCRNEVQEYLVWRVYDEAVDWFYLRDGEYQKLEPEEDGLIRSQVFPGLYLNVAALMAGDLVTVLTVVREGKESEEHAAFVERIDGYSSTPSATSPPCYDFYDGRKRGATE